MYIKGFNSPLLFCFFFLLYATSCTFYNTTSFISHLQFPASLFSTSSYQAFMFQSSTSSYPAFASQSSSCQVPILATSLSRITKRCIPRHALFIHHIACPSKSTPASKTPSIPYHEFPRFYTHSSLACYKSTILNTAKLIL
jgi:hypothetical protein